MLIQEGLTLQLGDIASKSQLLQPNGVRVGVESCEAGAMSSYVGVM